MKKAIKVLSLALASALAVGTNAATVATAETTEQTPESSAVYLVPGSYTNAAGQTVYNTVAGATKLDESQCAKVHTPNAYLAGGSGAELPDAETTNAKVTFNGWWAIENAEIVYYETVPDTAEPMFLYADWRAELSLPKDPVNPPEESDEAMEYYLEITRKATGKKERVPLNVSATDVPNAEQFGYGGPVQFYNEWFLLEPGDDFQIFVSRIYSKKPTPAPQYIKDQSYAKLESNTVNKTLDYINCKTPRGDYITGHDFYSYGSFKEPTYGYVGEKAKVAHHFRIYIKFYDQGDVCTIYMERQD